MNTTNKTFFVKFELFVEDSGNWIDSIAIVKGYNEIDAMVKIKDKLIESGYSVENATNLQIINPDSDLIMFL